MSEKNRIIPCKCGGTRFKTVSKAEQTYACRKCGEVRSK